MKTLHWFILTLCVFVIWGCKEEESSPTETTELSNQKTAQYASFGVGVELFSRHKYNNYVAATFSFRYATRDDSVLVRNHWDLLYGNDSFGDMLGVFDNSSIADLGIVHFEDISNVPISGNFLKEMAAQPGHVYVVHISDDGADFYAKFVITSMVARDKIIINWVRSDDGATFKSFSVVTENNFPPLYPLWGIGTELFSRYKYNDYLKATFSFHFATQGNTPVTYNDWDVLYDNGGLVIINGDTINSDRLEVNTITDDHSLITDLGTVAFDSVQTIPLGTDYADHAFAAPGHVYVVHTKDTDSDFYTKFIITAMKKRDWIRINWVRSADGLSFK